MRRIAVACGLVVLAASLAGARPQQGSDKNKADDSIVAKTRMKLDTLVTVDFKDEALKEVVKELQKQSEISFRLDLTGGVSGNQQMTYAAKDKALRDVLDEMFKGKGLGYVIHRRQNANDRYIGYVDIVQGDQRGDPAATGKEPPAKGGEAARPTKPGSSKPPAKSDSGNATAPDPERTATAKLRLAKLMADDKQYKEAREYLDEIIAKYPNTKAAGEAKDLLEKWKGKG